MAPMTLKRIARTSNYDSETYTETWYDDQLRPNDEAWALCHQLNEQDPNGPHYYCAKDPDYQLHEFQP